MISSFRNTKARYEWKAKNNDIQSLLSLFPKLPGPHSMTEMAPYKILIVDDEPDMEVLVRQRFRKKIKDGEFEFVFTHNGQEALEKLKEDSAIDVVMSDINMPVMDGLTLLSRLSRSEERRVGKECRAGRST